MDYRKCMCLDPIDHTTDRHHASWSPSAMSLEDDEPILTVPWVPEKSEGWKKVLRPAMISHVLQAQASPIFDDKCLVIEGRGFGKVTVVAHVTGVEIKAASSIYTLEDGTGRIRATKTFDSILHELSQKTEDEEITQSLALEHTYVEAIGAPRRLGSWTGLELQSIHPVDNYHQVMYHILNVIYTNVLVEQHVAPYNPDAESRPEEDMALCMDIGEANLASPRPIIPPPHADDGTSLGWIMSSPPSTPVPGPATIEKGKERALSHESPEPLFDEERHSTAPAAFLLEPLPMVADYGSTIANVQTTPSTRDSRNPYAMIDSESTPVRGPIDRVMPSDTIFPNMFTPRKRDRYAELHPLARAVIDYMRHVRRASDGKDQCISTTEIRQAVCTSYGYMEEQFNLTIQELLSEAYITSPLDDGFVVITPRR
ncbi:hypothetical protein PAXRUDRAFT_826087 [Paxillus rubicundulus Ve08.2h10]|uniref:Uncharacterized protein n=1 Tax=Paxillus rubicundulus Ve08.2h10 TaxID=930991 RepID=A0A0D0EA36_9AGAM|nr:hypothetical protein PAXRUDRAFT_826087 [Paxillus rubicundulus Ve08.2h10]